MTIYWISRNLFWWIQDSRELGCNYDPTNIVLETYNYDVRFEKEESADITKGGEECADLPPMKKK